MITPIPLPSIQLDTKPPKSSLKKVNQKTELKKKEKMKQKMSHKRYEVVKASDSYRSGSFSASSRHLPLKGSLTMRGGVSSPVYQVTITVFNYSEFTIQQKVFESNGQTRWIEVK